MTDSPITVSRDRPADNRGPIILMYHGTPTQKPASPYSLQARLFARHVALLKRKGWKTALIGDLRNPESLSPRTIIITFDDGYADNFNGAFIPLLENGMVATWFITRDVIGKYAHWMGGNSPEFRMLNDSQLLKMVEAGMEIGSHTCSHPDMSQLGYQEQLVETGRSKSSLESLLGVPVTSFAYPFGRFNEDTLRAVTETGYNFACSTRPGWFGSEPNPLLLRRVTIFSGDSAATLGRKLEFADNDVSLKRLAGYYVKRLASRLSS